MCDNVSMAKCMQGSDLGCQEHISPKAVGILRAPSHWPVPTAGRDVKVVAVLTVKQGGAPGNRV